jgi:hypothetical protein
MQENVKPAEAPPLPGPHPEPPIAVDKPAPLVDVVMYNLLGEDWKTTVQGALSFFALYGTGMALAVTGFSSESLISAHPKIVSAIKLAGLGITALSGIAKWYIGIKQKG